MKSHANRPSLCLMLVSAILILIRTTVCLAQTEVVNLAPFVPEPKLTFGKNQLFDLPKTLLFSANPDEIIADAEIWKNQGIDGFIMHGCSGGWYQNVWAIDNEPWTIGDSDLTLQKAKQANEVCQKQGMETFMHISFGKFFDWFNDIEWQQTEHNFRQFAIFARLAGCKGIAIDIEYICDQYFFTWKAYTYDGYTRADLVEAIQSRMRGVARAMYDEFPEMEFLILPELDFRLGTHIQIAWIEEAAQRNAPGGVHFLMGNTYRVCNLRYMFGRAWLDNLFFQKLLSEPARRYWQQHCTLAPGVWPFGHPEYFGHGPELTPEAFRHGLAGSRILGSRYNWIFTGQCKDQLIKRNMDKYLRPEPIEDYIKVMTEKLIVTNKKYLNLAQMFHDMQLRDYSNQLGLEIEVRLTGPDDYGIPELALPGAFDEQTQPAIWEAALDRFCGRDVNLQQRFGTQTHWMVIGPFPNEGADLEGHKTVYPPEREIDLDGEYEGVEGKVSWVEYERNDGFTSIDLRAVFTPSEHVCAYALCYVTVDKKVDATVRLGTNDCGKLWIGSQLVFDYPLEGGASLDDHIIPVTLKKGTTPILLKVCNGELNWGFVFRITDTNGLPLKNARYSVRPKP
ncbi:hypothetical protein JXJ21_11195 [candidate division KSB1 bacterium]|nr:hypothetical protein [candidate division KSB1 bacterium]